MDSPRRSLICLLILAACTPSDPQRETEQAGQTPSAVAAAPDSFSAPAPPVVPPTPAAAAPAAAPVTETPRDSGLVISPDSSMVAFIRTRRDRFVSVDGGRMPAQELWVARRDGSGARRLVEARDAADRRDAIGGFEKLAFSNDGQRLFFLSPAWTTSGAIYLVDVVLGSPRFVTSANSMQILRTGDYAGCLVASQHRYFVGGGSYDKYYLFAENGEEIGVVAYDDPEHLKTQLADLTEVRRDGKSNRSCASKASLRDGRR